MNQYLADRDILLVNAERKESTILTANQNGGGVVLEGGTSGRNDGVGCDGVSFEVLNNYWQIMANVEKC